MLSALKITFRCAMMTLLSVPVSGGWWLTSFRIRSIIGVEREPAGNTVSPQILLKEIAVTFGWGRLFLFVFRKSQHEKCQLDEYQRKLKKISVRYVHGNPSSPEGRRSPPQKEFLIL